MDEKTFIGRVRAGEILAVGEYRHSKSEMINWRDKQTGRAMSAPVLRHTIEFGNNSVSVSERVPEGVKLEDIKIPWQKGQMVVLKIEEISRNLGLVSARGSLEPFSNGAPSPGLKGEPVGGRVDSRSSS